MYRLYKDTVSTSIHIGMYLLLIILTQTENQPLFMLMKIRACI